MRLALTLSRAVFFLAIAITSSFLFGPVTHTIISKDGAKSYVVVIVANYLIL